MDWVLYLIWQLNLNVKVPVKNNKGCKHNFVLKRCFWHRCGKKLGVLFGRKPSIVIKKFVCLFIVSFVFKIQVTKIWVQFKYKLSKGKLMGLFQNFVLSINPDDDEHCSLVGRDGNLLQNAKTWEKLKNGFPSRNLP